MSNYLVLLMLVIGVSCIPTPAIGAELTSVSAGLGGRYLYLQQVGAQVEFQPFGTQWVRLEGGGSVSYKDMGSIFFAGAKIGPEFSWISPSILVGSSLTFFDSVSSVGVAGVNVQIHPIASWLVFGEAAKALPSVLDDISIGFGVGYRL